MTGLEERPGGLRAVVGGADREVTLEGWEPVHSGRRVAVGRADAVRVPSGRGPVTVRPVAERRLRVARDETVPLPAHGVRVDVGGVPGVSVGVDGPGTLVRDGRGVHVRLEAPTRVRVAVEDAPRPTVTVPPTAEGVAAAVSAAATAHLVTGPARSHPALRATPSAVRVGESVAVPPHLQAVPRPGPPVVTVPEDPAAALAVAPLAFYLGATVRVEADASPHVHLPAGDERVALPVDGPRPRRLLERVVWLDTLLRARTAGERAPAETALLEHVDRDPAALAAEPVGARLAAARDLPARGDGVALPPWHLATYLAPDGRGLRGLPYALARLAHVYPPRAESLAAERLMERSLDDFYRASRPTPSVDLVDPELGRGRLHGWLAAETPVETFRLLDGPTARDTDPAAGTDPLSVTLVLQDPAMVDERTDVAAAYHRGSPVGVTVRTERTLSRAALAETIAAETDVLHLIGHCEPDGLVCPDGHLPAAAVPESGAETVVLNACGSYHEGAALVRRGARAGVVTYRGVLDDQAATVGAAFARLVTRGFTVERAVRLARRQVLMGMDYGVVGDGTHRVVPGVEPVLLEVTPAAEGYTVTCETFADGRVGETVAVPFAGASDRRLRGGAATRDLDRSGLLALLGGTDAPVVYDGTVCRPGDLAARLRSEGH